MLNPIDVKSLRIDGPFKHLQIGEGSEGPEGGVTREISCKALVLTMGLAWQRLPAECAEEFEGRGIYYGAASTEALNCRDQVVYIVGAGNSAGQAAMHLVDYASKVVMVVRGRELGDRMSQYLVKRINECTEPGPVHRGADPNRGRRLPRRRATRGLDAQEPRDRSAVEGREQFPVRLHRRRAAHRLAGRSGGRETRTASSSPVRISIRRAI